jgi:hypothetical protein
MLDTPLFSPLEKARARELFHSAGHWCLVTCERIAVVGFRRNSGEKAPANASESIAIEQ